MTRYIAIRSRLLAPLAIVIAVAWLYRDLLPLWGTPRRTLFWDSVDFSYPFLVLASRLWRAHIAPWWNPFCYSGTPLWGNLQNMLLHPPSLVAALFTDMRLSEFQILEVIQIIIGALGIYLWGRVRTSSRAAGLAGAILFAGSGCVVSFSSHYLQLSLHCLLPYPFALFEMWDRDRKIRYLVLTCFALVTWLFTSYPSQLGYYLIAFTLFYVLKRRRQLRRPVALASELVAIGVAPLLIASIHLVPAFYLASQLIRSSGVTLAQIYQQSLAPLQLYSIVLGEIATMPSRFTSPDITLRNLSLGLFGCCALVYGLLRPTLGRLVWLAALVVCVDLMLGRHSHLIGLFHRFSPLTANSRHPAVEFGSLFSFVGLTLAMEGVADLIALPLSWRRLTIATAIVIAAALSFQLVAREAYAPNPRLEFASLAPLGAGLLFVVAGLSVRTHRRWVRRLAWGALLLGPLVDASLNTSYNQGIMAEPATADHFRNRDAQLVRGAHDYFALGTKWPRHPLFPNVSNAPMVTGERTDWGYDASILKVQLDAIETPAAHAVLLDRSPAFIADEVDVDEHPEAVPLLQAGRHVAAFARGGSVESAAASAAGAIVRIIEYAPHRIVYAVEGDAPTVVVFNELAIPG